MVSCVETGAFKYNTDWLINFAQRFLATLWAAGKWRIIKTLVAFELNSTILTAIGIYWHHYPLTIQNNRKAYLYLLQVTYERGL